MLFTPQCGHWVNNLVRHTPPLAKGHWVAKAALSPPFMGHWEQSSRAREFPPAAEPRAT